MDSEFWQERWRQGQIGFHSAMPNALLTNFWHAMAARPGSQILVPLCGKTVDMAWLRAQGHQILGVELSPLAVTGFFAEQNLTPVLEERDGFHVAASPGIELYCGDMFSLSRQHCIHVDVVYDRAALVALPADLQTRYVNHLVDIVPAGAKMFLITLEYDPAEMAGPPFAITTERVQTLFGSRYSTTLLHDKDAFAHGDPLLARGLSWLREKAYALWPRV